MKQTEKKSFTVDVVVSVTVKAFDEQHAREVAHDWCGVTSNAPDNVEFVSADVQNCWED